jgi:hypothetical protein
VLTFLGFATLGLVRLLPLQPGLYESHRADVRVYRTLHSLLQICGPVQDARVPGRTPGGGLGGFNPPPPKFRRF